MLSFVIQYRFKYRCFSYRFVFATSNLFLVLQILYTQATDCFSERRSLRKCLKGNAHYGGVSKSPGEWLALSR